MWRKIIPLLLVLSVGMNIAVLAIWGLRDRPADPAGTCSEEGDCPILHQKLEADLDQQRILNDLLTRFHAEARPICIAVDGLREELIDLIAAESPDSAAIAVKRAEIIEGQSRMQELVVEHLLAEKAVLHADQREVLFELLRSRPGCRLNSGIRSDCSP